MLLKENRKDKVKKQGIMMFKLEWTPALNVVRRYPNLQKHVLIAGIIIEPHQKNVQNAEITILMIQYIVRNVELN